MQIKDKRCLKTIRDNEISQQFDNNSLRITKVFKSSESKFQIENQFYYLNSLRGGGGCCSTNRTNVYKIIIAQEIPQLFSQFMIEHSRIIEQKAVFIENKQDKFQVNSSILWFIYNQEHFNTLSQCQEKVQQYLESILKSLDLIMKSTLIYVKFSSYFCIELLKICNMLLKVLFFYYNSNKTNKKLNSKIKGNLENVLTQLGSFFKLTTADCWQLGIEFELEMMNLALAHISTEKENYQELSQGLFLSISDSLIQQIFEQARQYLQNYLTQVNNPIQKYEVYCIIENMKWIIIRQIVQRLSIINIKSSLSELYNQYIKYSEDWMLKFCWINMICDLLAHRPIVNRDILLSRITNIYERGTKWKQLIKYQCIEQLPYNLNEAKCILFPNNPNDYERSKFLREFSELSINELADFQYQLMKLNDQQDQQFWRFCTKDEQAVEINDQLSQKSQKKQNLFNVITNILNLIDYQKSLLQKNQIIQDKISKLIQNHQYDQVEEAQILYRQELLISSSNLQSNVIEMIYFQNEISFHIFLMITKLSLIKNSIKTEDKSQFIKHEEDTRQKFINGYQIQIADLPGILKDFLYNKFTFEHQLNQNQIQFKQNPFQNTICQKIEQLINTSEDILKQAQSYKKIYVNQTFEEFISLNNIKSNVQFQFKSLLVLFLKEIINIWNDININTPQREKFFSIHIFLNIAITLAMLMQVKFGRNQTSQVMEALSSRRQKTVEDDYSNQSDQVRILIQKQQELIQKELDSVKKNQRHDVSTILYSQVLKNLNEIKKKKLQTIQEENEIENQMLQIANIVMNLSNQKENDFQIQLNKIIEIHQQIINRTSQQIHQCSNLNQSFFQINPQLQNFESLSNCLKQSTKHLMIFQQQTQQIIQFFELQLREQAGQQRNKLQGNILCRIQPEITKCIKNLNAEVQQLENGFSGLLSSFADYYDTDIPYIDIYSFLDYCLYFEVKDSNLESRIQDLKNDNIAFQNLIQFIQNLQKPDQMQIKYQKEDWRVKQCLCYNLINLLSLMQEEQTQNFCLSLIINFWVSEKDPKVKQILQNEELIRVQYQLFPRKIESLQQMIQLEVQERMQELESYHYKIQIEDDQETKLSLIKAYNQVKADIDQCLLNIDEIQTKLQINLTTKYDLKMDFQRMLQKLQQQELKTDDINLKIARLFGKKVQELLEIRKKKFLDKMNKKEIQQIYVEQDFQQQYTIQTVQYTQLIQDFFQQNKPQVMLIYGKAGVGKTVSRKKIEELIWKTKNFIPISASLAFLKNPTKNLINEILTSDKYGFNKSQVEEFKQSLLSTDLKVVFLLDSYDGIAGQFKYQNLFNSNELFNCCRKDNQIKLIIFCRKELLKQQNIVQQTNLQPQKLSQYQTWFKYNNQLLEAQLLEFNQDQLNEYLIKYCQLSVQFQVQKFQEKVLKEFGFSQMSFTDYQKYWKNIINILNDQQEYISEQDNHSQLLRQDQVERIIQLLKENAICSNLKQNQLKFLKENLLGLWNANKYKSIIQNLQIEELVLVPQMLQLILKALPQITQDFSQNKKQFIQNYKDLKQQELLSQKILEDRSQNRQKQWRYFLKNTYIDIKKYIKEQINEFHKLKIFNTLDAYSYQPGCIGIKLNNDIQDKYLIIRALQQKQISTFDFLDLLYTSYLEKQILKLKAQGKIQDEQNFKQDVIEYAESFSLGMIQNQAIDIQYNPKGKFKLFRKQFGNFEEKWQDKYFQDKDLNDDYLTTIREAILLTQRGNNFSFCHEKFPQFHVAKSLYQLINSIKLEKQDQFEEYLKKKRDANNSQQVQQNNSNFYQMNNYENEWFNKIRNSWLNKSEINLLYKDVLLLLKDKIQNDEQFKGKIIQLIQITSIYQKIKIAASNSISVFGFVSKDLSNKYLHGIKLSNTSLVGMDFQNSDLSNSRFENVNISCCNFSNSNLKDVNWSQIIDVNVKKQIQQEKIKNFLFKPNTQEIIYANKDSVNLEFLTKNQEEINLLQNSVICFDISNDGLILAYSGQNNYEINFFNLESYEKESQGLTGHYDQIQSISFSKIKNQLVSGSKDNQIFLWDFKKKKKIFSFNQDQRLDRVMLSQTDLYIVSYLDDCKLQLRCINDNYLPKEISDQYLDQIATFAFSYDDQIMATVSKNNQDKVIQLIDLEQNQKFKKLGGHYSKIDALVFLPDCMSLVSGGNNGTIILWNYLIGDKIGRIRVNSTNNLLLRISTDGRILGYLRENKQIQFLDLNAFQSIHEIKHPSKTINQILFSNYGLILATCNQGKSITLWDMRNGKKQKKLKMHSDFVTTLAFTKDGQYLASGSKDKIIITNMKDYSVKITHTINQGTLKKIQFSKNNTFLAFLSEQIDRLILSRWDLNQGEIKEFQINQAIQDFWLSPADNLFIYKTSNQIYQQFFYPTLQQNDPLIDSQSTITTIAFLSNFQTLAILNSDKKIEIWKKQDTKYTIYKIISGVQCLTFSQNQEYLAIGKGRIIEILQIQHEYKQKLKPIKTHQDDLIILQFSPNDYLLASASVDNTIKLYDTVDYLCIFTIPCSINRIMNPKGENSQIQNFLLEDFIQNSNRTFG